MDTRAAIGPAAVLVLLSACLGPVTRVYDDQITDPSQVPHFVGGVVKGLKGEGFALQNDGGETITVSQDGPFTFSTPFKTGDTYSVAVVSQPTRPTQSCTLSAAIGNVGSTNVANIEAVCVVTSFNVSGTVTGLKGGGLVLRLEAAPGGGSLLSEDVRIAKDGGFTFATAVPSGYTFAITVLTQPSGPAQKCTITAGQAVEVTDGDVTSIALSCALT